jgi:hypothetical protein
MRNDLPAPDLTVEDARRVLAAQPFSALLGATLVEFKPGTATCRCEIASDGIVCAVAEGSVRRTGKAQGDEQPDHARQEESS